MSSTRPRMSLPMRYGLTTLLGLFILYLNREKEPEPVPEVAEAVPAPAPPAARHSIGAVVALPVEHAAAVAGIEDVDEAAAICMQQWWMRSPSLTGELVIKVTRGAEGELSAAIQDYVDVPQTVVACLARAVQGRPWPQEPFDESWALAFP